ncbi:hypothetical protein N7376_18630 [Brucella intermedia GD04153]|uniref:Uncharacterized protein n=1 Tax=Brucella intermedia GD04153 TaxID=2975438 RepID=A0AA42H095_9HYPH|nr:hypothetical protein [Brucella intermedia]MDH0126000.1 hypothetical protein [Brucella intermedia GD04153]
MKDVIEKLEAEIANLKEENKRAFRSGYIIACCNIVHLHDEPNIAHDVLSELGITRSEVKALRLDNNDMDALREIEISYSADPYKSENIE